MISEPGTIRERAQLPTPEDMYRLMMKTVQQNSDMLHFMREERRADRISDWERQRERDRQTALHHAIQTFPKVSSKEYLPAQLENFTAILDSHEVPDDQRTCQLPGILTGQLAVTFQALKLPNNAPFEEAKARLLNEVGVTVSSAAKSFMRPDSEALKKLGPVDYLNQTENLIDRILTGSKTLVDVKTQLLKMYLMNLGSKECLFALAGDGIRSKSDVRQAIITCYENHGVVIDDSKNVAKLFLPPNRKTEFEQPRGYRTYNTRPMCGKCGKVGHRTVDCFRTPVGETRGTSPATTVSRQGTLALIALIAREGTAVMR